MLKLKHAANYRAYALGQQQRNGFQVRKVVWGLLMANAEKRQGEEIRRAFVLVGPTRKRAPSKDDPRHDPRQLVMPGLDVASGNSAGSDYGAPECQMLFPW